MNETEAEEVVASMRALAEPAWTGVTWELQDDATFLLVTVELADSARPLERNAPGRMKVFQALSEKLPLPPGGGEPSWMVVFVQRGEVIDSVMTGSI